MKFRIMFALCFLLVPFGARAEVTFNFAKAKEYLEEIVYANAPQRVTFYCGCQYEADKDVNAASCGYEPRKNAKRGKRIEWEHIVPASRFGSWRNCWQQGDSTCVTRKGKHYKGRRCCQKADPQFAHMEADLHNLVPAVGELNGDRSNLRMGKVAGEQRQYGACDFEINRKAHITEPGDKIRGDVARAYLYMHQTYNMPLSPQELEMFELWSMLDPISQEELRRNRLITEIQGNSNPFISQGF